MMTLNVHTDAETIKDEIELLREIVAATDIKEDAAEYRREINRLKGLLAKRAQYR